MTPPACGWQSETFKAAPQTFMFTDLLPAITSPAEYVTVLPDLREPLPALEVTPCRLSQNPY